MQPNLLARHRQRVADRRNLDTVECAVACVRVVLARGASMYLQRHVPRISALPPSIEKIDEATALLRRLHPAWLAVGAECMNGLSAPSATRFWESRLQRLPEVTEGAHATLATLLVQTRNPLLLAGTAHDAAEARAQLEALGSALVADVQDVALIADGSGVAVELVALLPGPALQVADAMPHIFCSSCGAPMGRLATDMFRCMECGSSVTNAVGTASEDDVS